NYQLTNLPTYQLQSSPTYELRSSSLPIHQLGFTIIDLLVVIAIISILATMGMAQYRQGIVHAREAVLKTDLFDLRDAIDQYYADKNQYPRSLDEIVSGR